MEPQPYKLYAEYTHTEWLQFLKRANSPLIPFIKLLPSKTITFTFKIKPKNIIMNQETFYMLYAENCNTPTYKHPTYESALTEAKRLTETLKVPVYVLQARQKVEKNVYKITPLQAPDELPF